MPSSDDVAQCFHLVMWPCLCLQSLENERVRPEMMKLVGLSMWHALSEGRRNLELAASERVRKGWKRAQGKVGHQLTC